MLLISKQIRFLIISKWQNQNVFSLIGIGYDCWNIALQRGIVQCQLLKIWLFCITPVISRKPTRDSVDYNILFRSRLCPHKHTWQAWPTLRFCTAQLSTTDQLLIQLAHASVESTEIPQRVTVTGANSGWASGAKPSKSFEFMINSRKVETGNTTSWLQDEEFRCGHSQEQL